MTAQKDPEYEEIRNINKIMEISGKHILEIGCGDGRLTWRYANHANNVIGIDPDKEALSAALVQRPGTLRNKVRFVQTSAVGLPFPRNRFDLTILAWSL